MSNHESPPARAPSLRRRILLLVASAACGGLVALLGLPLVPAVRHSIGPATLTARADTGAGRTTLSIPPLGTVSANTHRPPLSMNLSLVRVDVAELGEVVESSAARARLTRDVEADLRGLARNLALQSLAGGAAIGTLALALLPRRRWRYVLAGGLGAVIVMSLSIGAVAADFEVEAFAEPQFTGALERAPVVIEALNNQELTFPEVQSRFETAAGRLADLLSLLAEPNLDPRDDTVALLHIGDVHSNPIGMEIAQQLVRQFDVDAVLDTGDLTNFGVHIEARIAELVDDIDVPYFFVPGNHDSRRVQRELRTLPNVTLIDRGVVEIAGVSVLGWPDPTYTNWNALPHESVVAIKEAEAAVVSEAVRATSPDVLAVHDRRLAAGSYGYVPLVISGHYHKQIFEQENGTRIFGVGSTGASGLQSFTLDVEQNYEAEIIYFRGSEPVAFDYIRFTGLGSDFVIERKTVDPLELEPEVEEAVGDASP